MCEKTQDWEEVFPTFVFEIIGEPPVCEEFRFELKSSQFGQFKAAVDIARYCCQVTEMREMTAIATQRSEEIT
jgi:hypothetical protein